METSLHRSLKDRYAAGGSGRREVVVGGFRIDAIDEAGRLIEVQSGALGPLRGKLRRLLPEHRLRIVKPVVLDAAAGAESARDGPVMSARRSPKRGALVDIFDDLIGRGASLSRTNLDIEVLGVTIDEVRVPRRRRPGYTVADRRLGEIHETAIAGRSPAISGRSCPRHATTGSRSRRTTTAREIERPFGSPNGSRIVCASQGQPASWARKVTG